MKTDKSLDLSIIIVNYNTPNLVYDCLKTIKQHVKGLNYEAILVENGSTKGKRLSKDKITLALSSSEVAKFQSGKEEYNNSATQQLSNPESWKLVTLESNLGFGGGNNAGAKLATGNYLFLLNPDTLLVDDSATKILSFLDTHPEIGAVTPLLYQKDGKTLQNDFYGSFQSFSTLLTRNSFATSPLGDFETKRLSVPEFFIVDRISAAALMIKRELFEQIKGFDKNIFLYMEDDDLCKKINDLGYYNAVLKTAKIIHLEGQATTSKEKKRLYYKSQSYFWRKHYGLLPTFLMQIIRWPYKLIKTK